MNKYEMMFIVKATMESENVKATAENMDKHSNTARSSDKSLLNLFIVTPPFYAIVLMIISVYIVITNTASC